jgi:hypothetical protein
MVRSGERSDPGLIVGELAALERSGQGARRSTQRVLHVIEMRSSNGARARVCTLRVSWGSPSLPATMRGCDR